MAKMTPQEFAEKQARRLKGSLEDVRAGIERVTASPTQKAVAKKAKFKARLNESIDSGKWERGLMGVTLESWRQNTLEKGVNRISGGIDAARPKVEAFAAKLLPFQDALRSQIAAMPDATLDDNIARMDAFIRGMAKFKAK